MFDFPPLESTKFRVGGDTVKKLLCMVCAANFHITTAISGSMKHMACSAGSEPQGLEEILPTVYKEILIPQL